MPDFDVQGFVADVERLGLMLRALPLADGSIRLNLWRMPNAIIHAQRIEALWALKIGENQDRVQQLGAHVMQRDAERSPPSATGARVGELVSEIKRGTTFNVSSRTTPE